MDDNSSTGDVPVDVGIEAERRRLVEVGRAMHGLIPAGSSGITLEVTGATAYLVESRLAVIESSGDKRSIDPDDVVTDKVSVRRRSMYRPGFGTWFGAVFSVTIDGKFDANYNYDDEPTWVFPVDPVVYVNDLAQFPRDDAHMPEWLRQKVRDHEAGKTE